MCYAQSIMLKPTAITNLHDSKDKMNIQKNEWVNTNNNYHAQAASE